MTYNLAEATAILARTPALLDTLLRGLSPNWVMSSEGPETWSPYDVVGHLIHAEVSNWLPRVQTLLENEGATFAPFDRFAYVETRSGEPLETRLEAFASARAQSLTALHALELSESDMEKSGIHPELGRVSLRELLATWVVHDFTHVAQIVRTMAKQYEAEVGPWRAYLSILRERR